MLPWEQFAYSSRVVAYSLCKIFCSIEYRVNKVIIFIFSVSGFFMVEISFENLKLPRKTAKLQSKVQIAVQKSWSNC